MPVMATLGGMIVTVTLILRKLRVVTFWSYILLAGSLDQTRKAPAEHLDASTHHLSSAKLRIAS